MYICTMKTDLNTEVRIKKAAKIVFIKKGMSGARMQEIADEAGINKAMLHYYYRSKEKLFQTIFKEIIDDFFPNILEILGSDLTLSEKVKQIVNHYIDAIVTNPSLPLFIFNEMRNHPQQLVGFDHSGALKKLDYQLKKEANQGNILLISAPQFMANLISMTLFPFLAQPMIMGIFGMDQESFNKFVILRKTLIPHFIMRAIKIK